MHHVTNMMLLFTEHDTDYPIHLQYSSSEAICSGKKAKVLHKLKCNYGTNPPQFHRYAQTYFIMACWKSFFNRDLKNLRHKYHRH
jgi:hypothetical protein